MDSQSSRISRSRLCELLAGKLSKHWLADENRITDCLAICFDVQDRSFSDAWCQQLAQAVTTKFSTHEYANRMQLVLWLKRQPSIKALFRQSKRISITRSAERRLQASQHRWNLPQIESDETLCGLLGIETLGTLQWLTLPHRRRSTCVNHYRRRPIRKKSGQVRWLEEPLPVLKAVQGRILAHLLSDIPLHESSRAFRKGYSIASCAACHVGKRVVLRMDCADFFGSISLRRVCALFRNAGYGDRIAIQLAQLCSAPAILENHDLDHRALTRTRLPQGAPTSPALSNAVAFQMDRRLAGLARAMRADYTRYADDLIFSGDQHFASGIDRFSTSVAAIVDEEGFAIQFRKTQKLFSGGQQRVLGITTNERLNIDRREYERLRAILHNCREHGWHSQNRQYHPNFKEHLRGRIGRVMELNTVRGKRLLASFEELDWGAA